jgi:hypothetical protein
MSHWKSCEVRAMPVRPTVTPIPAASQLIRFVLLFAMTTANFAADDSIEIERALRIKTKETVDSEGRARSDVHFGAVVDALPTLQGPRGGFGKPPSLLATSRALFLARLYGSMGRIDVKKAAEFVRSAATESQVNSPASRSMLQFTQLSGLTHASTSTSSRPSRRNPHFMRKMQPEALHRNCTRRKPVQQPVPLDYQLHPILKNCLSNINYLHQAG